MYDLLHIDQVASKNKRRTSCQIQLTAGAYTPNQINTVSLNEEPRHINIGDKKSCVIPSIKRSLLKTNTILQFMRPV
jgi:hypothetical protein